MGNYGMTISDWLEGDDLETNDLIGSRETTGDEGCLTTGAGTTLSLTVDAFEEISESIKKDASFELDLKPFCEVCSIISTLFGSLRIAFKFAKMEYTSKVC
ncbi:hypothetical protein E3N88_35680 [Mikania micrantha]|uniref:Uncharacterized protein n=1 Tax=Mikania micrantha TaxID=192012 RepID=A0A5N6M1K8_9ASTR|nr:hypothetical protein E3N88_35680 [Mikania micrantha]